MTNDQQCLTSNDVCQLLHISIGTLYKRILRDPEHPVTKAKVPGLRQHRFKRTIILEYIGANQEQ
jgi:hypothetical protein